MSPPKTVRSFPVTVTLPASTEVPETCKAVPILFVAVIVTTFSLLLSIVVTPLISIALAVKSISVAAPKFKTVPASPVACINEEAALNINFLVEFKVNPSLLCVNVTAVELKSIIPPFPK